MKYLIALLLLFGMAYSADANTFRRTVILSDGAEVLVVRDDFGREHFLPVRSFVDVRVRNVPVVEFERRGLFFRRTIRVR